MNWTPSYFALFQTLQLPGYPAYHTGYETFFYTKSFVDSTFTRSQAVAQVWAEVARHLGDAVVLPMDAVDYAVKIAEAIEGLKTLYEDKMKEENIYFGKWLNTFQESKDHVLKPVSSMYPI